jgi:peptidoglycan/xylan/chitin deacetylase (PgdA/CDA1 family)
MYHELETHKQAVSNRDPGYLRYVISANTFAEQMLWLKSIGWRGMSVSEGLQFPHTKGVVITFDDGSQTDLLTAAPLLRDAGFSATFYVIVGLLGRPGYLAPEQVRELHCSGFEIGCHSMTHAHLNDLSGERLDKEITGAKIVLEEILGDRVEHFSCPGGRWTPRIAKVAKEAGFESVATSSIQANSRRTDPLHLGRVAVTHNITLKKFQTICDARGLWPLQLRDLIYGGFKVVLGNSTYDHVRSFLLRPRIHY